MEYITGLLKGLWADFLEFMGDWFLLTLAKLLDAVAGLLESLTPPDFTYTSLSDTLGPAMPYIGSFLAQSGITEAFALLAAAFAFRVVRKIVTLGRW